MSCTSAPVRLLVLPGLHDSGPTHWQTWLQRQFRDACRVEQHDWARPDLPRWADAVQRTLAREAQACGELRWVAVAQLRLPGAGASPRAW
jgi:predicted alpha/beta hydrolase family esterase